MNDTILAFQVLGKIFSGLFLTPESLAILVLFGIAGAAVAIKFKLEQQ